MRMRILANLGLMLLLVLPIWFGLMWVLIRITEGPQGENHWSGFFLTYSWSFALVLLVGGLLQQLTLLAAAKRWSSRRLRIVAILSALVIPVVAFLPTGRLWLLDPGSAVPLALGLLAYGFAQRLPKETS